MKIDGFTLVELMITIAVAAILLATATPSFTSLIQNHRLVAQHNDFVANLNLARSEAVKRGVRVTLCKSADATHCTNAGGWEQGWIMFVDRDNDAVLDDDEEILRVHAPLKGDSTLRGTSDVANYIAYVPGGFTRLVGGPPQTGTLILCDARGFDKARAIVIGSTGRPRATPASETGLASCAP